MKYKRILLKISGEVLAGSKGFGLDDEMIMEVCQSIKACRDAGVDVGVVVGGGNFWRGRTSGDMGRVKADHIGMLATVMNAIALSDGLDRLGVHAVVETAAEMKTFAAQERSSGTARSFLIFEVYKRKLKKFLNCPFGAGKQRIPARRISTGARSRRRRGYPVAGR